MLTTTTPQPEEISNLGMHAEHDVFQTEREPAPCPLACTYQRNSRRAQSRSLCLSNPAKLSSNDWRGIHCTDHYDQEAILLAELLPKHCSLEFYNANSSFGAFCP
jgi:hypothetical protein